MKRQGGCRGQRPNKRGQVGWVARGGIRGALATLPNNQCGEMTAGRTSAQHIYFVSDCLFCEHSCFWVACHLVLRPSFSPFLFVRTPCLLLPPSPYVTPRSSTPSSCEGFSKAPGYHYCACDCAVIYDFRAVQPPFGAPHLLSCLVASFLMHFQNGPSRRQVRLPFQK